MYSVNYNKTVATLFLVRPLGLLDKKEMLESGLPETAKLVREAGFISAYLADVDYPTILGHPLFLLFKSPNLRSLDDIISKGYKDKILKDEYDYAPDFTVLLYDYPSAFHIDYEKIVSGRYSSVSDHFKSFFPYSNPNNGFPNMYCHVFEKSRQLKASIETQFGVVLSDKDELWVKPEMEKETLDIEKLRKNLYV